jgi:hypothetical protein
VKLFGPDHE